MQRHRSRAQERDKGGEGEGSEACAASLSSASPGDASSHADHCKQRATASHPLLRSTHVPQSGAEAAAAGGGKFRAWFTSLKPVKMANIITPVLSCLSARAAQSVRVQAHRAWHLHLHQPLAQLACQFKADHHRRGKGRAGGRQQVGGEAHDPILVRESDALFLRQRPRRPVLVGNDCNIGAG